jgi:hypothetical protein
MPQQHGGQEGGKSHPVVKQREPLLRCTGYPVTEVELAKRSSGTTRTCAHIVVAETTELMARHCVLPSFANVRTSATNPDHHGVYIRVWAEESCTTSAL